MKETRELVDLVIRRLSHLGSLTSRSMFGGYGICENKVMFSIVSENKFYLRANNDLEAKFIDLGMEQLVYVNRGLPILMRYYHVNSLLWEKEQEFNEFAGLSLAAAKEDKRNETHSKGHRLKELPNITLSIERLLWRAGIHDRECFYQVGAVKAFLMIKNISQNISVDVLFALAGAIEGRHSATLTENFRASLLNELK